MARRAICTCCAVNVGGCATAQGAYDFTWQLAHKHRIDPATYADAAKAFGDKGLVDIVMLVGLYMTTCSIINAFEVPIPAGNTPRVAAPVDSG